MSKTEDGRVRMSWDEYFTRMLVGEWPFNEGPPSIGITTAPNLRQSGGARVPTLGEIKAANWPYCRGL